MRRPYHKLPDDEPALIGLVMRDHRGIRLSGAGLQLAESLVGADRTAIATALGVDLAELEQLEQTCETLTNVLELAGEVEHEPPHRAGRACDTERSRAAAFRRARAAEMFTTGASIDDVAESLGLAAKTARWYRDSWRAAQCASTCESTAQEDRP